MNAEPRFQRATAIFGLTPARHRDERASRRLRHLPEASCNVVAVAARKADVDERDLRPERSSDVNGRPSVASYANVVPMLVGIASRLIAKSTLSSAISTRRDIDGAAGLRSCAGDGGGGAITRRSCTMNVLPWPMPSPRTSIVPPCSSLVHHCCYSTVHREPSIKSPPRHRSPLRHGLISACG